MSDYNQELKNSIIPTTHKNVTVIHKNLLIGTILKLSETTKPENGILYQAASKSSEEAARKTDSQDDAIYAECIDPNQAHGENASSDAAFKHNLKRISTTLLRYKSAEPDEATEIDTVDEEEETTPKPK